jgi:hypothetical protein
MAELTITPSPNGWTCGECRHWLAGEAALQALIQTPGGIQLTPIAAFMKAGQKVPDDARTASFAPCTEGPQWQPTPKHHWCWRYCPKSEGVS